MAYNIRIVSTYPPRKCGVGIFARNLATALEHFTGEVSSVRVVAIRRSEEFAEIYTSPVDLTIDQYDPRSWKNGASTILTRARETSDPTIVLFQHEYGLDPDGDGEECRGENFVDLARRIEKGGLLTLAYLHTVLDDPNEHQRKVVRKLAQHTEGLIVTTESAIDLLVSKAYGINRAKIRHMDHGVRIHLATQNDRLAIKQEYGLEDQFLIVTLGLRSPDKGIQFSIPAYAGFLEESCTQDQRQHFLYLIAGQCHPEFIGADDGRPYRAYLSSHDKENPEGVETEVV
jgi:hypothetical protein